MPDSDSLSYLHEHLESVNNSVKSIYDLTGRIDERLQNLITKNQAMEKDVELIKECVEENIDKMREKIHGIEITIKELQIASSGQEGRWKTIFNFGLQIVWVLLAAFLLYKLGLQAPP